MPKIIAEDQVALCFGQGDVRRAVDWYPSSQMTSSEQTALLAIVNAGMGTPLPYRMTAVTKASILAVAETTGDLAAAALQVSAAGVVTPYVLTAADIRAARKRELQGHAHDRFGELDAWASWWHHHDAARAEETYRFYQKAVSCANINANLDDGTRFDALKANLQMDADEFYHHRGPNWPGSVLSISDANFYEIVGRSSGAYNRSAVSGMVVAAKWYEFNPRTFLDAG